MDNFSNQNTPPHSNEAEQSVLGAIFLDPKTLIDALEYLEPEDFYLNAHRLLFQAMIDLNNRGDEIDVVTMQNELKTKQQVDDIGGLQYISDLAVATPTARNITYYAKIVAEKALLRRLINAASGIVNESFAQKDDVETILDDAERQIMDIGVNRHHNGFKQISDLLTESLTNIDALNQNDNDVTGLSTGYADLDRITAGLHPDELIVLAARPGVGKTAFALNIAQNIGTQHNDTAIAIFSLEMGAEQLVNRMVCAEGNIDANHLRTGQLNEAEWHQLVVAMAKLATAKIYIDDTPGIKMAEIRAKCRRLQQEQKNLGLIVVDYLQLIEGSGQENRQQEISTISRQLKKLAKELHVPVLALSQLNRGIEQRQDKRPLLSDIRESGSIEQDADIVAFLYREDYYRSEDDDGESSGPHHDEDENVGPVEVIVEKNRSGPRDTANLLFVKSYNKFSSVSPREAE